MKAPLHLGHRSVVQPDGPMLAGSVSTTASCGSRHPAPQPSPPGATGSRRWRRGGRYGSPGGAALNVNPHFQAKAIDQPPGASGPSRRSSHRCFDREGPKAFDTDRSVSRAGAHSCVSTTRPTTKEPDLDHLWPAHPPSRSADGPQSATRPENADAGWRVLFRRPGRRSGPQRRPRRGRPSPQKSIFSTRWSPKPPPRE